MQSEKKMLILRLFGAPHQLVLDTLKAAAKQGCPGLNLMQRGSEYVVCVTATASSGSAAQLVCDQWETYFREKFGAAVFGTGTDTLADAAVKALYKHKKVFVAADPVTGGLLNNTLKTIERSKGVYDFGLESYAHPQRSDKLLPPKKLLKKYPSCPVQPVAGVAAEAVKLSNAHWAVAYRPARPGGAGFVLVWTKQNVYVKALAAQDAEQQATAWLLDMLRRLALSLPQAKGVERFVYGKKAPPVIAPEPPQPQPQAKPAPKAAPQPAATSVSGQTAATATPPATAAAKPGTARPQAAGAAPKAAPQPAATSVSGQTAATATPPATAAAKPGAARPQAAAPPQTRPLPPLPPVGQDRLLAPSEPLIQAAGGLFDDDSAQPEVEAPRIDDEGFPLIQHRRRPLRTFLIVLLVATVAVGAAFWLRHATVPDTPSLNFVGYGTADYDTAAKNYLQTQQQKSNAIAAYLALPNLNGALVYGPEGGSAASGPAGAVFASEDVDVRIDDWQTPGKADTNLIINCPKGSGGELRALADEKTLVENSGFTLYTSSDVCRYKILSVFYWDETETGESALALRDLQDLSNKTDYLNFVLGAKARSIFTMPADVQDGDSFATLIVADSGKKDYQLVVVGRLVRSNEAAILFGRQVVGAEEPLLPQAMYLEQKQSLPDITVLRQYWNNWYATGGATASDVQENAGMPETDLPLDQVDPTGEGQEGTDPSASPSGSASPSPTPTGSSSPSPTPKGSASPSPTPKGSASPSPSPVPTKAPTPEPTKAPSSGTIAVTMNGVRQEMDLVECLAMVARNELGANAPYEAYKAQIVATHSWILNQGGAPSVSGLQPSENIRNAAREVADKVLTYNGSVAFTPYFASAAYGTNSSQEVWGGARAYLVNVDSPYDQNYASNWKNTRTYYVNEVASRAQERLGIDLRAYSENPADWMGDLSKNSSGYVNQMRIGGITISGRDLREKVLNNVNGKTLRSAAFDISYNESGEAFDITTYGYGHGCGLSQYGAWGYASNGWGYADILSHYFPGTSLESR